MVLFVRGFEWRGVRRTLAGVIALLTVVGVLGALTGSSGAAAPNGGPRPMTLTFAGQVIGDEGLSGFVDPYPPIEGGTARVYTVPTGYRLVIESVYADLFERWSGTQTGRSGAAASVNTWYDLGDECAYPGYQRNYGIPLTEPVVQTSEETERRRTGNLPGPIYVEGGRSVNGNVFSPNGDSELFTHIVAHGYLEPTSSNPSVPVCGQP